MRVEQEASPESMKDDLSDLEQNNNAAAAGRNA